VSGGASLETLGLSAPDLALLKAALPAPASVGGPRSPGTSSRASSKRQREVGSPMSSKLSSISGERSPQRARLALSQKQYQGVLHAAC